MSIWMLFLTLTMMDRPVPNLPDDVEPPEGWRKGGDVLNPTTPEPSPPSKLDTPYQGRDPERIEAILSVLAFYWKTQPDQRLGQLLNNLSQNLPNVEDWALVDLIVEKLNEWDKVKAREGWQRFFDSQRTI